MTATQAIYMAIVINLTIIYMMAIAFSTFVRSEKTILIRFLTTITRSTNKNNVN